ncbi:hypothetical protein [Streptomyces specialis]|uniref:hypothetical protein n=1 Tax=Streptomyces specialis TaxID=498367 RepID=UPI00073F853D|nr:hypothetical protein [Streptomyces specialis]
MRANGRLGVRAWRVMTQLVRHELALWASLARWIGRRPAHGVKAGDRAVAYAAGQTALVFVMLFVSVVETVALALLIPWPAAHRAVLAIDVWGIFFVVGLHASCAVRPHVVGRDGSLRVRYGALVDIAVPADRIASVRLDRRFPGGRTVRIGADGTVDLAVGGQTNVTVVPAGPVVFRRPLGGTGEARVLRIYADDPGPLLAALHEALHETSRDAAQDQQQT